MKSLISRVLRCATVLFAGVALHGCPWMTWYDYDATNKPIAAGIAGRCFELRQDTILAEYYGHDGNYLLNLPGANECTPQDVGPTTRNEERYKSGLWNLPKCAWVPVAKIAQGTRVKVTSVTEKPRGGQWTEGGIVRCWKVGVTITTGPHSGVSTAIPSCHFDFPEAELWLRMQSPSEYVTPLELADRVAIPCLER